jgi:hypothetical protein
LNDIEPFKNCLAFKLEGIDRDWHYSAAPEAPYSGLRPGKYVLLVNGSNNYRVWYFQPASLGIVILSLWWATWHASVIYVIILFILACVPVRIFLLRLKLQREREFQLQKLNFLTDVSRETAEN